MTYSLNTSCNTYNGQCECKRSADGGSYGGRQCTQCAWNAIGRRTAACTANHLHFGNNEEMSKIIFVQSGKIT